MSRIGKKPVTVPAGVEVSIDSTKRVVNIKGAKGALSMTYRPEVSVNWEQDEKRIVVSIPESEAKVGQTRAYWGTTRSLIANMIEGGKTPVLHREELEKLGFQLIVYPLTGLFTVAHYLEKIYTRPRSVATTG